MTALIEVLLVFIAMYAFGVLILVWYSNAQRARRRRATTCGSCAFCYQGVIPGLGEWGGPEGVCMRRPHEDVIRTVRVDWPGCGDRRER